MKVSPGNSEHWQLRSMEGICYIDKKSLTACACQSFRSACFMLHLTLRCWVPVGSEQEQEKVAAHRPAYKEPLWWPVAAGEGQLQALSKLAISRQILPSPLPSLSTGRCMSHMPSSAECSAQTTEPLCPLRAGTRTSLGSATKINLNPSGERAARRRLKQCLCRAPWSRFLPCKHPHFWDSSSPLCFGTCSSAAPQLWRAGCLRLAALSCSDPASAQGREDALQSSVLLKSLCLKKSPFKKCPSRGS